MSALLAQAQQMQQKLMEAQQNWRTLRCMVRPVGAWSRSSSRAAGEVVAVKIDPSESTRLTSRPCRT